MPWISVPTVARDAEGGSHAGYYKGVGDDLGLLLFQTDGQSETWIISDSLERTFSVDGVPLSPTSYDFCGHRVWAHSASQSGQAATTYFLFWSASLSKWIVSTALAEPWLRPDFRNITDYDAGTAFWEFPMSTISPGDTVNLVPKGMAQAAISASCSWRVWRLADGIWQSSDDDKPAGIYKNAQEGSFKIVGTPCFELVGQTPTEFGGGELFYRVQPNAVGAMRYYEGSGGHTIYYDIASHKWRINSLDDPNLWWEGGSAPKIKIGGQQSGSVSTYVAKTVDGSGDTVDAQLPSVVVSLRNFVIRETEKKVVWVGEVEVWR